MFRVVGKHSIVSLLIAAFALHVAPVAAIGTAANTNISNNVSINYEMSGTTYTATASASFLVQERLEVTTTWQDASNINVVSPSTANISRFLVTNTGNGVERFILSTNTVISGDDFDPVAAPQIWIDDGDGIWNAVSDTQFTGANGPLLDGSIGGGESALIFVLADMPGGQAVNDLGRLSLTAASTTASVAGELGNTAAVIAGGGDGGVNAIVGVSGAQASAIATYQVVTAGVSIVKSVVVSDVFGGSSPSTGATLRYTLTVNIAGSSAIDNLVITDAIPANTTYNPNSISLDTVAQSDAADAPVDFSDFNISNPGMITVDLSQGGALSIAPPASFEINFEVIID